MASEFSISPASWPAPTAPCFSAIWAPRLAVPACLRRRRYAREVGVRHSLAERARIFFASIGTRKRHHRSQIDGRRRAPSAPRGTRRRADRKFSPGNDGAPQPEREGFAGRQPQTHLRLLSGFGADGPMSDAPGYDLIVQAWGGLMSITGRPTANPAKSASPLLMWSPV